MSWSLHNSQCECHKEVFFKYTDKHSWTRIYCSHLPLMRPECLLAVRRCRRKLCRFTATIPLSPRVVVYLWVEISRDHLPLYTSNSCSMCAAHSITQTTHTSDQNPRCGAANNNHTANYINSAFARYKYVRIWTIRIQFTNVRFVTTAL